MLFTSSFVAKMEFCMASIWQPSYMTTETHRGLLICAAKSVQDTFQWKLFSICTTFSPDSLRWIGQKIESNWTEPNRRLCLSPKQLKIMLLWKTWTGLGTQECWRRCRLTCSHCRAFTRRRKRKKVGKTRKNGWKSRQNRSYGNSFKVMFINAEFLCL